MEDIDLCWVLQAEKVWRVCQWARIFYKMAQQSKVTLIKSEIEGLKVCLDFFLFSDRNIFAF